MSITNLYLETYTGVKFTPMSPDPDQIRIEDIAHSLSNLCRYAGHCREFYSVAQHSILVAELCSQENRLWGLLHDASEAYLADIPRPVKIHLPEYKRIESDVLAAVAVAFDLPWPIPDEVKDVDDRILKTEHRDVIMPHGNHWVQDDLQDLGIEILQFMCPENAKNDFLLTFDHYTKKAA